MNKQTVLLAASLLAFSTLSVAADTAASTGDKAAVAADTAKPAAESSGAKARKATVPETAKDRENKKKCRRMGGTWQLGHCNVG